MDQALDKVILAIRELPGMEQTELEADTRIEQLNLDSLHLATITMEIESILDIQLDDDQINRILSAETVGEIADAVRKDVS